jgi:TolB-like protein/Tfp pilus assembly protein PilF
MSLFSELKRRNVLRVAIAYLAVAWLFVQIVETIFPVFDLPDSLIRLTIILLAIGFPIVLIFSWLYELTPEGIRKDQEVDHSSSSARRSSKRFDRAIIVVLTLCVGYFAFDKFVLDPARDAEIARLSIEKGQAEALEMYYGESSIAVLPFENMSGDASNEYFSDGMAEELLNLLARVPNLRVISRSSSFAFKGKDFDVPSIAMELDVAHVLQGSVRRSGGRIRISAQLIDARSNKQVWSESYDREIDDLFAVQDEISASIVKELKGPLGLEEHSPQTVATTNPDAHEAFLRGRFLVVDRTKDGMENALVEFEKAIELDTAYAKAHAEAALAHLLLAGHRYKDKAEAIASAQPHVLRALALDQSLAESLGAAGFLSVMQSGWTSDESKTYFEKAIQLNPNYADAYHWLGANYERMSPPQYQKSFDAHEMSVKLDPLSHSSLHDYSRALISRNRLEEADAVLEKLATLNPAMHAQQHAWRMTVSGGWGFSVLDALDSVLENPEQQGHRGGLRTFLAILGLEAEAVAVFDTPRMGTLWWLGKQQEVLAMAELELAQNPTSQDAIDTVAELQPAAGVYDPARQSWEEWWQEDPQDFSVDEMAALIAIRRSENADSDMSDIIELMKEKAQRPYEAGVSNGGQVEYFLGLATFLGGDHEEGFEMIASAVDNGYFIIQNVSYLQTLYDYPGYSAILETQQSRQERERHRVLTVVCNDNPYESVWQPEPGTCEAFATEQ